MDIGGLVQTLTATLSIDAAERTNAEAKLNEVTNVPCAHSTALDRVWEKMKIENNVYCSGEFHMGE